MFIDRNFGVRVLAAAATMSLGVATAAPVAAATPAHRTSGVRAIPTGTVSVLHSFNGTDGSNPQGALVLGLGLVAHRLVATLYGTTQFGGAAGDGNVFSQITHGSGAFASTLSWSGPNGSTPSGGLLGLLDDYSLNGEFVGVTSTGGANGMGTIYEVSASGAQTVLYSFTGGADGANPIGRLLYYHGALYGTTSAGAAGFGTIFRLTGSGQF